MIIIIRYLCYSMPLIFSMHKIWSITLLWFCVALSYYSSRNVLLILALRCIVYNEFMLYFVMLNRGPFTGQAVGNRMEVTVSCDRDVRKGCIMLFMTLNKGAHWWCFIVVVTLLLYSLTDEIALNAVFWMYSLSCINPVNFDENIMKW